MKLDADGRKKWKLDIYCHIFLLPKEAHANVVPEWGALRNAAGHHLVLGEGDIEIPVGLHHAASSQGGLGMRQQ